MTKSFVLFVVVSALGLGCSCGQSRFVNEVPDASGDSVVPDIFEEADVAAVDATIPDAISADTVADVGSDIGEDSGVTPEPCGPESGNVVFDITFSEPDEARAWIAFANGPGDTTDYVNYSSPFTIASNSEDSWLVLTNPTQASGEGAAFREGASYTDPTVALTQDATYMLRFYARRAGGLEDLSFGGSYMNPYGGFPGRVPFGTVGGILTSDWQCFSGTLEGRGGFWTTLDFYFGALEPTAEIQVSRVVLEILDPPHPNTALVRAVVGDRFRRPDRLSLSYRIVRDGIPGAWVMDFCAIENRAGVCEVPLHSGESMEYSIEATYFDGTVEYSCTGAGEGGRRLGWENVTWGDHVGLMPIPVANDRGGCNLFVTAPL